MNLSTYLLFDLQIFSKSVAAGLRFYKKRDRLFDGCDKTIEFTEWINDLFDSLNRKFPKEGIRKNGKDFKVISYFDIY